MCRVLCTIGGNLTVAIAQQYAVIVLGPIQSTEDSGKAINSSGTVAFTQSTAVYLWHNGIKTQVPNLFAGNGPLAINDAGDLAGSDQQRGFLYRNGVKTDLGVFSGGITFAEGLDNNDNVVGESYDQTPRYQAFKWTNGSLQRLPARRLEASTQPVPNPERMRSIPAAPLRDRTTTKIPAVSPSCGRPAG